MIIAISGKVGSGKSTVAKMLSYIIPNYVICSNDNMVTYKSYEKYINKVPTSIDIYSFATPIKEIAAILTYYPKESFNNIVFKNSLSNYNIKGRLITNRELLTHIGDILKNDDPSIFARILVDRIKDIEWAIIDDLRFKNEYNYLYTERPDTLFIRLNTIESSTNHISEIDLDDVSVSRWNYILNERLSEKELFNWCKNIVRDIYNKLD